MPPNAKGGKGYKKGKHSTDTGPKMMEWDDSQGQMLGRVLKKLGDRRFRIFCNDNKERICKLCGSMRKSDWVDEGALVIIGVRELSNARADSKVVDLGDVLAVVDPRLYGKLKKLPNQNQLLFHNLESVDENDMKRKVKMQEENAKLREEGKETQEDHEDEGGIIFEREGDEESGEEKDEEEWGSGSDSEGEITSLPAGKLSGKARDKLKLRMSEQRARSETFATQRAKNNKAILTGSHTTSSGSTTDASRKNQAILVKDEEKEINIDDI